jgi:hypothetical protein
MKVIKEVWTFHKSPKYRLRLIRKLRLFLLRIVVIKFTVGLAYFHSSNNFLDTVQEFFAVLNAYM